MVCLHNSLAQCEHGGFRRGGPGHGALALTACQLQLQLGDVEQVYVVMECGDYDLAHALHMYANATQLPYHVSQAYDV